MNGLGRGEKKQENKISVVTRETVGMTMLLFSIIIFLIVVTGKLVFGDIGTAITAFFVGLLGFFVYPFLILAAYLSLTLVSGKKFLPVGWIVKGLLVTLAVFFIVHTATAERFVSAGYGGYLGGCWNAAKGGASGGTGGGVLFGLIAFPVRYLLSEAGAYIIFSLLLLGALFYCVTATRLWHHFRNAPRRQKSAPVDGETAREYPGAVSFDDLERTQTQRREETPPPVVYPAPSAPAQTVSSVSDPTSRDILYAQDPAKLYQENLIFNKDSHFNSAQRRSTVYRQDGSSAPVTSNGDPAAYTGTRPITYTPPAPSPSYTAQYAKEAEKPRPQMPRKVTGSSIGYVPQDGSFNYPQAPSYRAPEATGEKKTFTQPLNEPEQTAEQPIPAAPPAPAPAIQSAPPVAADPRELPPVRAEEPAPAPEFPRYVPSAQPSKRRTSLHDYLAGSSEETKKNTPSLEETASRFAPPPPQEEKPSRFAVPEPQEEKPSRFTVPEAKEEKPSRFAASETPRFERGGLRRTEEEHGEEAEGSLSSGESVFDARPAARRSVAEMFDDDEIDEGEPTDNAERFRPALSGGSRISSRIPEEAPPARAEEPAPAPAPAPRKKERYQAPAFDNLLVYDETITVTDEEVERNVEIIQETLRGFNVEATFLGAKRGPAVTQYNIDIPRNVSVSTVLRRDAEIAMRLHAQDGVNIYSNPLAEAISIEVPNKNRSPVSMRTVMQAEEYKNAKPNSLMFTMGMSIEGKPVCGDIVSMKHILMAGATGSGKSVMMNSMLVSLLYKYSPEDLRLILIDPKKIEFGIYEGIPHLMIREVITEEKKVVAALAWAVNEMERRYGLFEKKVRQGINVREIAEYNEHLEEGEEKLPKIVIVIDELADLMATVAKDIEVYIQRIAQKARAAGMHLVLATQRPSADIITGIIKANLPTRIAFHVAQEINSRIVLDETGADKLLGLGDMLYKTEKMSACERLQGVLIKSKEVEAVIKDIKANNHSYYDQSVDEYINKTRSSSVGGEADDKEVDEKYIYALRVAVDLGQASISLIQRKCSVGYNHAGKMIEWMEKKKYITPFDGQAKARKVLLSKEEFKKLYGGDDD